MSIKSVQCARDLAKEWAKQDCDNDRWLFVRVNASDVKVMIDNDQVFLEPIIDRSCVTALRHQVIAEVFADMKAFDNFGYEALHDALKAFGIPVDFV